MVGKTLHESMAGNCSKSFGVKSAIVDYFLILLSLSHTKPINVSGKNNTGIEN